MSHFSTQLKVALERAQISRDKLAEASGLSYSLLTNLANDRREPDNEILEAIAKALPPDIMADVLVALWCDVCPEKLRALVHVIPTEKRDVLEEPQAPYGSGPKLDAELEGALDRVKWASIKYPEWRSAVVVLSKTIPD